MDDVTMLAESREDKIDVIRHRFPDLAEIVDLPSVKLQGEKRIFVIGPDMASIS